MSGVGNVAASRRVLNDQESIDTLQDVTGYLLEATNDLQKIFGIVGPTRSGKGTIGRVLSDLHGDAACRPTLNDFADKFGAEALIGMSLAVMPDALSTKGRTQPALSNASYQSSVATIPASIESSRPITKASSPCAFYCYAPNCLSLSIHPPDWPLAWCFCAPITLTRIARTLLYPIDSRANCPGSCDGRLKDGSGCAKCGPLPRSAVHTLLYPKAPAAFWRRMSNHLVRSPNL
jgi:hypothetical protein